MAEDHDPTQDVVSSDDNAAPRATPGRVFQPYSDSGHVEGSSQIESQRKHAQEVHDRRKEREADAKDPAYAQWKAEMMKFAKDAKPGWFGKPTAAEKNTFGTPGNAPKSVHQPPPATHPRTQESADGVFGGNITFIGCVDNGDGTFSQGSISAAATFVPSS